MERRRDDQTAPGEHTVASAPSGFCPAAATRDWSRRVHRRACMQLVRQQRIEVSLSPPATTSPRRANVILSRGERAHFRLSWTARLSRNARAFASGQVTIKLFGLPEDVAKSMGHKQA